MQANDLIALNWLPGTSPQIWPPLVRAQGVSHRRAEIRLQHVWQCPAAQHEKAGVLLCPPALTRLHSSDKDQITPNDLSVYSWCPQIHVLFFFLVLLFLIHHPNFWLIAHYLPVRAKIFLPVTVASPQDPAQRSEHTSLVMHPFFRARRNHRDTSLASCMAPPVQIHTAVTSLTVKARMELYVGWALNEQGTILQLTNAFTPINHRHTREPNRSTCISSQSQHKTRRQALEKIF